MSGGLLGKVLGSPGLRDTVARVYQPMSSEGLITEEEIKGNGGLLKGGIRSSHSIPPPPIPVLEAVTVAAEIQGRGKTLPISRWGSRMPLILHLHCFFFLLLVHWHEEPKV